MYSFHSHEPLLSLSLYFYVFLSIFRHFILANLPTLWHCGVCVNISRLCAGNIESTYLNKNVVKHFVCWGMAFHSHFRFYIPNGKNRNFFVCCCSFLFSFRWCWLWFCFYFGFIKLVRIWSHQKQLSLQSFSLLLFYIFLFFWFSLLLVLAVFRFWLCVSRISSRNMNITFKMVCFFLRYLWLSSLSSLLLFLLVLVLTNLYSEQNDNKAAIFWRRSRKREWRDSARTGPSIHSLWKQSVSKRKRQKEKHSFGCRRF